MSKTVLKCVTVGCHRRLKIAHNEVARLREMGEEEGQRAGVICPDCTVEAMFDEDEFIVEMTPGEVMVELLRPRASWHMVFEPFPLS